MKHYIYCRRIPTRRFTEYPTEYLVHALKDFDFKFLCIGYGTPDSLIPNNNKLVYEIEFDDGTLTEQEQTDKLKDLVSDLRGRFPAKVLTSIGAKNRCEKLLPNFTWSESGGVVSWTE